jgi:hypothetical protein
LLTHCQLVGFPMGSLMVRLFECGLAERKIWSLVMVGYTPVLHASA